jgi:hypothetical protein
MIRQLAAPQPQLAPEISVRSDEIVIDFMEGRSCASSNWATVGLSEIRNTKYVMVPAEDPPVQTIVTRGCNSRRKRTDVLSGGHLGDGRYAAANEGGAKSITRNATDTAAKTARMTFDMDFARYLDQPSG